MKNEYSSLTKKQIHMKCLFNIIPIILLSILASCHKDELSNDIVWDKESENFIKNGILISPERQTLTLNYINLNESSLSVCTDEEWLDVSLNEESGELTIQVSFNKNYDGRTGIVMVTTENQTIQIQIHQKGNYMALPENMCYRHDSNKGSISVRVKANGLLDVRLRQSDCNWAQVSEVKKYENDEWLVTVMLNENQGLGRIVSLEFKVDGSSASTNCGPCIIQEPAPFNEDVEIKVSEPGMLSILMGDNANNFKRIRNLTIIGSINGLDFPILKKLFSSDDIATLTQPISIDLSDCAIVAGYKNPYQYYGWEPDGIDESIPVFYGEIPQGIFTNARNLTSIRLPESLKVIGRMAFSGCSNLERITIPDIVEDIGSKAFWECPGIKEINILANSNLIRIGNQAFTTGSLIESLSLPEGLVHISGEAFLGCNVSKLHLHWTYPFEVRIVPNTENCILYVPIGTADVYRTIRNWCNFKQIIEE